MSTGKLFWLGCSQALRLRGELRFEDEQVWIRRHGAAVILAPIDGDRVRPDELDGGLDADVVAAALEKPQAQLRAEVDALLH